MGKDRPSHYGGSEMDYRRWGRTEAQVSVFTLGTMRMVGESPDHIHALLEAALSQGINHFETAPVYGDSESQLGQWLGQVGSRRRARLFLTTKVSPSGSADQMRRSLEDSLRHLQTDYVDHLAFHGINLPEHLAQVLQVGIPVMRQAQAEGLVRHLGFSTHGPLELILQSIASAEFEFVNLHYYYFNQRNAPAIEQAALMDMGVFIISPADKGGMLYRPPQRLQDLCSPWSPLTFGYQFLLSDPRIHTLSLGASSSQELQMALQEWRQEPLEVDSIPPAFNPVDPLVDPSVDPLPEIQSRLEAHQHLQLGSDRCSQCFACLPCPEEIPIPEILRLRNLAVAFDMEEYGKYRYNMLGQSGHWFPGQPGNRCTSCGNCLPRCPQQLPIPELLIDTHQRLNQSPIRRLWE